MPYTFVPKQKFAKASARDARVSAKSAKILCRAIRKKPLVRARRLLTNLIEGTQTLEGKTYDNAAREVLNVLNSCEKNAEFIGLDPGRLMVHASATHGRILRRKRRKAGFGSRIKAANIEVMLIERGKESKTSVSRKKIHEQKHKHETKTQDEAEKELSEGMEEIREKSKELKEKVEAQN